MKTSNNGLGDILLAKLDSLGSWLVRHAKIVMPVVLAACVIITVVISIRANKKETEQQENIAANSTLEDTMESAEYVVPEVALQQNTISGITELINTYYTAQAAGDIDTIRSLVSDIDDSEVLRIEETSKYIDAYSTLDIYTKEGPLENTSIV